MEILRTVAAYRVENLCADSKITDHIHIYIFEKTIK